MKYPCVILKLISVFLLIYIEFLFNKYKHHVRDLKLGVLDSFVHALTGFIIWFAISFPLMSYSAIESSIYCSLFSSIIDIDHFIMSGSLLFQVRLVLFIYD